MSEVVNEEKEIEQREKEKQKQVLENLLTAMQGGRYILVTFKDDGNANFAFGGGVSSIDLATVACFLQSKFTAQQLEKVKDLGK